MKDIRFIRKNPNSEKATFVYLKYACDDGYLQYSTGEKITKRDWNEKMFQKPLDRKMASLKTYVDKYVQICEKAGKEVLSGNLGNHLRRKEGKTEKAVVLENRMFARIRNLIDDAKAGRQPIYSGKRLGGHYSKGTLKHWDLAYNKLMEFNPNLDWDVTMQTYHDFLAWCNKQKFRPNYTGTLIKMWKVFMTLGLERHWHNNHIHLNKSFRKITEKVPKVYLNEEEIQALIIVPLNGMQKIIRDSFIINLNLGFRISDMKELKAENYSNGIIRSVNRKTGAYTAVPANGDIKRIIAEYGGFPKAYSEQVINREIKKIARLAGITELINYTETIGGVEVIQSIEKCELISNHTCRRSFITNKLKLISIADVAKFAGSTIKNIEHYNKVSVEELAADYVGKEAFK